MFDFQLQSVDTSDSEFFHHRIQVHSVDAKVKLLVTRQQILQNIAEPVSLKFDQADFIQQDGPDQRIGKAVPDGLFGSLERLPLESETVKYEAVLLRWRFIRLAQSDERKCFPFASLFRS